MKHLTAAMDRAWACFRIGDIKDLYHDHGYGLQEAVTLYFIQFIQNAPSSDGWCRVSQSELADMLCVCEKTMNRMCRNMVKSGLLDKEKYSLKVSDLGRAYISLKEPKKAIQLDLELDENCGQKVLNLEEKTGQKVRNLDENCGQNVLKSENTPYSIKLKEEIKEKTVWSKKEKDHVRKHGLKALRKCDLPDSPHMYVNQFMDWLFDQGHQVKVNPYPNDFGIEKMAKIWAESRVPEGGEIVPIGHLVAIQKLKLEDRDRTKYIRRHLSRDHLMCAFVAIGATGTDLTTFDRVIEDPQTKYQWDRYKKIYTEEYINRIYLS